MNSSRMAEIMLNCRRSGRPFKRQSDEGETGDDDDDDDDD